MVSPFDVELFYYIRHGITEANDTGLICGGDWDVPLSGRGVGQARMAAPILSNRGIQSIISSPMVRAIETSKTIADVLKVPCVILPGLEERHIGDWERRPWAEVEQAFLNGDTPPGGECRGEFRTRILSATRKALQNSGPVLIVSHGGVWLELCALLGLPETLLDNCLPVKFTRDSSKTDSRAWACEFLRAK